MKDGYIEEMDWEVLMDFSRICLLNSRKLPHFILYISRFLVYSIRYTYSTQIACAPTRADKKSIQYDNYTDWLYTLWDNQLYCEISMSSYSPIIWANSTYT